MQKISTQKQTVIPSNDEALIIDNIYYIHLYTYALFILYLYIKYYSQDNIRSIYLCLKFNFNYKSESVSSIPSEVL